MIISGMRTNESFEKIANTTYRDQYLFYLFFTFSPFVVVANLPLGLFSVQKFPRKVQKTNMSMRLRHDSYVKEMGSFLRIFLMTSQVEQGLTFLMGVGAFQVSIFVFSRIAQVIIEMRAL